MWLFANRNNLGNSVLQQEKFGLINYVYVAISLLYETIIQNDCYLFRHGHSEMSHLFQVDRRWSGRHPSVFWREMSWAESQRNWEKWPFIFDGSKRERADSCPNSFLWRPVTPNQSCRDGLLWSGSILTHPNRMPRKRFAQVTSKLSMSKSSKCFFPYEIVKKNIFLRK